MSSPFKFRVYDKDFAFQAPMSPSSCDLDPAFNALGVGSFAVPQDAPIRQALEAPGARVKIDYRGDHLMSGPIQQISGNFAPGDDISYRIEDDWRILPNTLGWVVPFATAYSGGALTPASLSDDGQSREDASHTAGTAAGADHFVWPGTVSLAEAAIKHLIKVNVVDRLGLPVVIAPNLGRGPNARTAGMLPEVRFDDLEEALADLLEWSELGLRVWHDGVSDHLTVDVWEPTTFAQTLSVKNGAIVEGTLLDEQTTRG